MTEEKDKPMMYKIIVMPFTKGDAMQIRNYLTAFVKGISVEIEGIP
jgi:hypothetical protein